MKKFGIENPSFPPLQVILDIRQKREECCRDHGSYGSGIARKPSHQRAPFGYDPIVGLQKIYQILGAPILTVSITIFKERIRICFR